MERQYAAQIFKSEEDGKRVFLKGWVSKINDFGKLAFVHLRDKTGCIQLVVENLDNISGLKPETAVEASGFIQKNPKAPGGMEIKADNINIIGKTYFQYMPFNISKKSINAALEVQLDNRTITLRRKEKRAIFKIQGEITEAFRRYLREKGFMEIHTPKIVASGTEGGSEVFTVNYFGTRAFLAQSPQFYKQMMVGAGFEAVYEIGHAYRAELHNTWRHLNEYVSLDVEMGFIDDEISSI